tara:strand:+ start:489 stop:713 length:225 start_codon:yes stop_codon:yes gene_type:complete
MTSIKSLKMASTIASLGNMLGGTKTKAEEIAWKKRMLKTQHGISFPDDFDSLPEDEQLKRLNGAINAGLDKNNK